MYILLIQPPPALQPSPCPVPPRYLRLLGGMLAAAVAALLCCAHGVQILPALPPKFSTTNCSSRGSNACFNHCRNTNQRGTFCCSCLHLFFKRFVPADLFMSHPQNSQAVVVPSLAPGQGSHSRGWGWGQGLLGKRLLGCVWLAQSSSSPAAHDAHDGSLQLPEAGAASCLPPAPKSLSLGTSTPGCSLCSVPAHPGTDWLYRMYFVPLQ